MLGIKIFILLSEQRSIFKGEGCQPSLLDSTVWPTSLIHWVISAGDAVVSTVTILLVTSTDIWAAVADY